MIGNRLGPDRAPWWLTALAVSLLSLGVIALVLLEPGPARRVLAVVVIFLGGAQYGAWVQHTGRLVRFWDPYLPGWDE